MRWMAALIWRLPPRSRRWRLVLPELTGIGAMPPARASLASVVKRWAPAISPIELACGQRPEAGLGEQLRRDLGDELGDLGLERVDGLRELAQVAQLVAGDPDARRLLGARQAPRDARVSTSSTTARCPGRSARARGRADARAGRYRARCASERAVRGDRPAAGCRARRRPARRPAADPGPRAAPRERRRARRYGRTCRARGCRGARRPSTASRREPRARRERAGTARTRPRRVGSPPAPTPALSPSCVPIPSAAANPRSPTSTVCSPSSSPLSRDRGDRVRALVGVRTEHDHDLVPFTSTEADARRTRLAWGGATLLSSHAGTSPTGDERHSESQSGPTADSVKASQLAAGREPLLEAGRHDPIQTASVKAAVGHQVRRLTWSSSRSYLAILIAPQQAGTRLRHRSPSREPKPCMPARSSLAPLPVLTRTLATMTRAPHGSVASRDARPRLASHLVVTSRLCLPVTLSAELLVDPFRFSHPHLRCSALVPSRLLEPLNRSRPPDRPFRGAWVVGIGERARIPAGAGRERPPTHVNRRTGRERDRGTFGVLARGPAGPFTTAAEPRKRRHRPPAPSPPR